MKISKKAQYGLRAMVCLADNKDRFQSLREISESEGISFDYLEKILSQIEKKGLIHSRKGIQGGYILAKTPRKITVGEILTALEGKMVLVECIGSKDCAREKTCPTKNVWKKLQSSLEKTINSITLSNLLS